MESSFKKVLIVVAGGSCFGKKHESGTGVYLPSDDELRSILEGQMAAELIGSNIQLGVEIIGRDETGASQTPKEFNDIGDQILQHYNDYDGFVVLHGADTIPWAASHLAFSFENLAKTIVFADSRVNTVMASDIDSQQAVITAAQLAAHSYIPEVTVLSSKGILVKGVDAILYDAGTHAGFSSRNQQVLARIGKNILLEKHNILPIPTSDMLYSQADLGFNIGVYQAHPVCATPISGYIDQTNALVIQAPGFGNIDLNNGGIREGLIEAQKQRIPIVVVTECHDGHINFGYTDHGEEMVELGLINGGSMTTPAAVTKLRSLLSHQIPYEEISKAMATDMFGETLSYPTILSIPDRKKISSDLIIN